MKDQDYDNFDFYNLGLQRFKVDPIGFYFRLAKYKFIWRAVPRGSRVLDLATGDGLGAFVLSQKAGYVLGVDREIEFIEYAKHEFKNDNLEFLEGDALVCDLGKDWDIICLIGLLEYLTDCQSEEVVGRIAGALKPGGIAFVGTPNRMSQVVASERRLNTHLRELTAGELSVLLGRHFSRVELYGQNDEYILPSIPEMSFFLIGRCQK